MTSDQSLKSFLEELASAQPTPGGGGAAALCGAMAAALTSMVCNLTIGKKKYLEVTPRMKEVLAQSESLREGFSRLMDEDAQSFSELLASFKLPKETPEEQETRSHAIQEATMKAAQVPLEVIRKCAELLPIANLAAEKGNVNVVSDAGVAALMLGAAAQSAALNVNINLMGIRDRAWAQKTFDEMNSLLAKIRLENEALLKTVSQKLGG